MHDFAMVCWVIVIVAATAFMLLWVGAIFFAVAVDILGGIWSVMQEVWKWLRAGDGRRGLSVRGRSEEPQSIRLKPPGLHSKQI
jgi:hypothetical protein